MSNFRLVIVAPTWTPILEQLIQTTQDYYDLSVLTKRTENLTFSSEKLEILQCFDELSPWEVLKLTPWLLQKTPALYHFVLTEKYSNKELMALSTLASFIRGIPRNTFSYSLNCYLDSWSRFLLKPLMENETPLNIWGHTPLLNSQKPNQTGNLLIPARTHLKKHWYFPFAISTWSETQKTILRTLLQLNPQIQVAIPEWGDYPLRKRNVWRAEFQNHQGNINMPFMVDFDNLPQNINTLILAGGSYLPWNESELIVTAQLRIPIIMDEDQVEGLEAPWKHGDQIWILNKNRIREGLLEFMNQQDTPLSYESLQKLSYFQDHRSNQLLRAFSEKFNLIE
jgi:hypothetical protein